MRSIGRESATGPRLNSARASGCTPPCSLIRVVLSGIRVTRFGMGGVCWLRASLAASNDTSAKAHPNGSFRNRFFIFGYPNCPDSADATSTASGEPRDPTSFLPLPSFLEGQEVPRSLPDGRVTASTPNDRRLAQRLV